MKISTRLQNLIYKPVFYSEIPGQGSEFSFNFNQGANITVWYKIDSGNILIECFNQRKLTALLVGLFDALLAQLHKRPIGAINRVGIKDLDYGLRDDKNVACVEYYPDEMREFFALTASLYKQVGGIIEEPSLVMDNFFDLSFSEQIDLFEEFLAAEVYPRSSKFELDIEDIEDRTITIVSNSKMSSSEQSELEVLLSKYIKDVKLNFLS